MPDDIARYKIIPDHFRREPPLCTADIARFGLSLSLSEIFPNHTTRLAVIKTPGKFARIVHIQIGPDEAATHYAVIGNVCPRRSAGSDPDIDIPISFLIC